MFFSSWTTWEARHVHWSCLLGCYLIDYLEILMQDLYRLRCLWTEKHKTCTNWGAYELIYINTRLVQFEVLMNWQIQYLDRFKCLWTDKYKTCSNWGAYKLTLINVELSHKTSEVLVDQTSMNNDHIDKVQIYWSKYKINTCIKCCLILFKMMEWTKIISVVISLVQSSYIENYVHNTVKWLIFAGVLFLLYSRFSDGTWIQNTRIIAKLYYTYCEC